MKRKDRAAEKRKPVPSGLAGTAPRRRAFVVVNFAFGRLAFATRPFCSVTSPLPKKSFLCKFFSGALFYSIFRVVPVYLFRGVCLVNTGAARLTPRRNQTHATVPNCTKCSVDFLSIINKRTPFRHIQKTITKN